MDKIELFKFDNAWNFFKATDGDSLSGNLARFTKITSENAFYINKLTDYFPEDALAATIKNVDDYEDMAVGTKKVLFNVKALDEAAPGADAIGKATFLKNQKPLSLGRGGQGCRW